MLLTSLLLLAQAATATPPPPGRRLSFHYDFDKAFFERADRNKDGFLDLPEFRAEVRKLMDDSLAAHPDARAKLDEAKLKQVRNGFDGFFRSSDVNADGRLSMSEIQEKRSDAPPPPTQDRKDMVTTNFEIDADFFQKFDTDKNSALSWSEFRAAWRERIERDLDAHPEQRAKATEEKMNVLLDSFATLFGSLDRNGDGQLTLDEVKQSPVRD
jgi:Ca2+-binding EF-hand superfamily protein